MRRYEAILFMVAAGLGLRTPAMAVGVTDHRWTTEEVLRHRIRYA